METQQPAAKNRSARTVVVVLGSLLLILVGTKFYDSGAAVQPMLPDTPRDVDLGKLPLDVQPTYTFRITNSSDTDLKVISIQKSCGCENVGIREGTIIPKQSQIQIPYSLSKYGAGK